MKMEQTLSHMYTPTILKCSHYLPTCLWRWNRQSVPKRRHIKFRRRGITQKKTYNIQNTAKVWNQKFLILTLGGGSRQASSPSSFTTRKKEPQHPHNTLNTSLGGPQSLYGAFKEKKNLFALLKIKQLSLDCSAHSWVTKLTELIKYINLKIMILEVIYTFKPLKLAEAIFVTRNSKAT